MLDYSCDMVVRKYPRKGKESLLERIPKINCIRYDTTNNLLIPCRAHQDSGREEYCCSTLKACCRRIGRQQGGGRAIVSGAGGSSAGFTPVVRRTLAMRQQEHSSAHALFRRGELEDMKYHNKRRVETTCPSSTVH